jgi:hypothetical protein
MISPAFREFYRNRKLTSGYQGQGNGEKWVKGYEVVSSRRDISTDGKHTTKTLVYNTVLHTGKKITVPFLNTGPRTQSKTWVS